MARHHTSKKRSSHKRHLSAHDRAVDRENLLHGRKAKHHSYHSDPVDYENENMRYHAEHEAAQHERDEFNDERHAGKDRGGIVRRPLRDAELYAGMESRRRSELEDAGMIHEDHRAIANLPQEVMIKPYPRTGPYLPEELDDSMEGVDRQMDFDDSQRRRHFYPKKV